MKLIKQLQEGNTIAQRNTFIVLFIVIAAVFTVGILTGNINTSYLNR